MSQRALEIIKDEFADHVVETHSQHGDETIVVKPEVWRRVMQFAYEHPQLDFKMLTDLTVVDYLGRRPRRERFEVVVHLYSITKRHRIRIKARLPEGEPRIDSLTPIWAGADWFEREAWDLYGVRFNDHPNLRRILLYEEFEGHPLRKDYPVRKRQPLIGPRN